MTHTPEQLIRDLKSITLGTPERDTMRRRLAAMTTMAPYAGRVSLTMHWIRRHAIASSLGVVVLALGTTTALASTAGPGDALYPLRIAVGDQVQVVLASDEDARITIELSHLDRDIADATTLGDRDLNDIGSSSDAQPSPTPQLDQHSSGDHHDAAGDAQDPQIDAELQALQAEIDAVARETPPFDAH